jgi:putative intracellular protease/amidase
MPLTKRYPSIRLMPHSRLTFLPLNRQKLIPNFTVPFKLEDALNKASGGNFVKADKDWGAKVVVSRGGRLITGQNPASATGTGQAIYDAIFGELTTRDEI